MYYEGESMMHLSNGVYKRCRATLRACPLGESNHLVLTKDRASEINEILIEKEAGGVFNQGLSKQKKNLLQENLKAGSNRFYWAMESLSRDREIIADKIHRARYVDPSGAYDSYLNYKEFEENAEQWLSEEDAQRAKVFFSRLELIYEDVKDRGEITPYAVLKEFSNEIKRLQKFNFYQKQVAYQKAIRIMPNFNGEIESELKRLRIKSLNPIAQKKFGQKYPIPNFKDDPKIDPITGLTAQRHAERLAEDYKERERAKKKKRQEEAEIYARSLRGRIDHIVKSVKEFW